MTQSIWLDEKFTFQNSELATANDTFDIAIVGGGIAGLSTAYWLEKRYSNLKILIIDKNSLGFGASGRNAGFVTCGSAEHFYKLQKQFGLEKAVEIWKFSEKNRELLKSEIIQGANSEVDFYSTGSCTVAPSVDDWSRYQDIVKTMNSVGIDVDLINEAELSADYGVRNFHGAIEYKHDGIIHPIKLLRKIKSKLQRTRFLLNENVLDYKSQSENSWQVTTSNGAFTVSKLIFCLNGYANTLLPELKDLVKPQRGQIIVTEKLKKFIKGPCYLTKHLCYFRQLPEGELLVGGFRNHDPEAENTNQDEITEKIQAALADFTRGYFQNTQDVRINYRWSGIMGFTPDGQMMIGEVPHKKGLYAMAGCSGHGMGLSFHAAQVLVDSIDRKPVPEHLRFDRFFKQDF